MKKRIRRLKKIENILLKIQKIVVPLMLYFGSVLISSCGFILLFSTMEILALKLGVGGLLLVMSSSFLDNTVTIFKNKNSAKIERIKQNIILKNGIYENKVFEKEVEYYYDNTNKIINNIGYLRKKNSGSGPKVKKLIK